MGEKDWISDYFAHLAPDGLRDDVAVLSAKGAMIITQDAMVESVHFLPEDPIDTVARKLVRVNVSDILAKGALPHQALLTLGWRADRDEAEIAPFAAALGDELGKYGASLIGGDSVVAPQDFFVSLTLTGKCIGDGPVTRSGAKARDDVWVTGVIGAAQDGLRAIFSGHTNGALAEAYRLPALPPPAIAHIVAAHASASIDVSDGLLGDAEAIAKMSEVQLTLFLDAVPFYFDESVDISVRLMSASWGDDYQTLFTAPRSLRAEISAKAGEIGVKLARIGTVEAGKGLKVTENGQIVNLPETLGYEHG